MLLIYQLIIAVLLFATSLVLLHSFGRRYRNLPPGPMQLAFEFSSLRRVFAGKPTHELFQEEGLKQYGPIIYTKAGFLNIVVIQDYEHIKEALIHKDWVDRIYFFDWFAQRSFGKILGVFVSSGECWKEMRQFTMRTLRDFGFGRGSMEMFIRDEVEILTGNMATRIDSGECTLAMRAFFAIPTLNILLSMLIGDRSKTEDPKLIKYLEIADKGFKEFGFFMLNALNYHIAAPKVAKFLSHFSAHIKGAEFKEFSEQGQQIMREIIDDCRVVGAYKTEPRNFVDAFLREIDANQDKNGNCHYTEEQLITVLLDLFLAGAETTSNTLEFAILYMVLHPDIQDKVQAEIDEVIGSSRCPVYSDKSMYTKMPYTEATILEIHRKSSVVPIFPLTPTQDTRIGKYSIPKGTIGLISLYAMNMDANTWKDPLEFQPERFLDSKLNVINAHKVLPFGAGRRVCFGESLASASLFTFLVTLLQRFNFKVSPNYPVPTMKPVNGVTLSPAPFHCLVQERG